MPRKPAPKGFAEPKTPYGAPPPGGQRADGIAHGKGNLPPPEILPDGTVRYFLVLGQKGRVLLPTELRAAMRLEQGDVITAWLKDGEVRMHSHRHGLRKIVLANAPSSAQGGVLASDELIAERRAEAAKDAEEDGQRAHRKPRK